MAGIKPDGSLLAGLLFLASAIGGIWSEYHASFGYEAQPYDWLIESISDLGVPYPQVHPLKHYTLRSYRAKTLNNGLMWIGATFALGHLYLFVRTRQHFAANVASLRSVRALLAFTFAVGAFLMASIHGGPREKLYRTVGWHWNGFAFMAVAGNFNSIIAGIRPHQVGGVDGNLAYRAASVALGAAGIASFIKFTFMLGEWNHVTQLGLWQRGTLYAVVVWQVLTGLGLVANWAVKAKSKSKSKRA